VQVPGSFDVIDVLTRAGDARDAFAASVGDAAADADAQLVSDLLRTSGRVGDALETRRALVELCALVRAIDAAEQGRIDLQELRAGLELHAARTDRFAEFHDARVLLRTLTELLSTTRDPHATRAQVAFLHRELRAWLLEQLTGDAAGDSGPVDDAGAGVVDDPRLPYRTTARADRIAGDALVTELLQGAQHYPVTGLLGAAWRRDWSAVPLAGEMLGDDPGELARLAEALDLLVPRPGTLVQVARRRPARWRVRGRTVDVGDHLRSSWHLPASPAGLALAATERAGWAILTTSDLAFAYVEASGHHALLGPAAFVERACGMPPLEAVARFREHVESLAVDGEPPDDLLEVATSFGRLRRRSR
jgi:hypothetical protein